MDKMRENRLKWFSYVMKRNKSKAVRMVMEINAEGSRGRERLKKRWMDVTKNGMKIVGMRVDGVRDRVQFQVEV